jgi:uncharacterized protein YjbI with pentapeptide repeats
MTERSTLSRTELELQLASHKQWLETDGAQGERADLSGRSLAGVDLQGADLRQADLSNANLEGATLADAKLNQADLRQTMLLDADLSNADLTDAHGLAFYNLAAADLTGAILPSAIVPTTYLDSLKELYNSAKTTFNVLLVASGYSILTILITTDDRLLRNVSASPLPFIGTEAPVLWFYVLMPIVITTIYILLITNISRLWNTIQRLPAIFPDGSDLTTLPYCWVLTDATRQAMPRLRMRSNNPRIAQHSLQCFLLFSFPIFALLLFWWYYIPLRNEAITWLHVALITLCSVVTAIFFCDSIWSRTLFHNQRNPGGWNVDDQPRRRLAVSRQAVLPLVSLTVGVLLTTTVYFISFHVFSENADRMALAEGESCPKNLSLQLLCQMKHKSYVDVRYKTLSSRPANWSDPDNIDDLAWGGGEEDGTRIRRLFDPVDGVDLRRFDLGYADAQYTFLAKARLEDAILDRADLKFADLRLAYLDRAKARGAYLSHADLRRARLNGADLEGAFLDSADLTGANLAGANLAGACLQGANLDGAVLAGAVFEGADVSGALLGTNASITKAQLDAACANDPAQLPAGLSGQTFRKCPTPDEQRPCP